MSTKQIFRACKLQGLALHSDALKRLAQELENEPSLELEDVIFAIKNNIDRSKMPSSVVTLEALESALDTLLAVSTQNEYDNIQVFNAFDTPRIRFNPSNNCFELKSSNGLTLHGTAADRNQMFQDRFRMMELRVKRNKMFAPPSVAIAHNVEYTELSKIESLLGVTGIKRVMGILGLDERKRIYVEDETSRIYLDLSNSTFTTGLFTVNCIVLVEGEVIDDVMHAHSMGMPPPESRQESLDVLSGLDPLGMEVSPQQLAQIRELEAKDHHASFIVLSDVHLDDPQVMKHLRLLFEGLEAIVPTLFILMGDFLANTNAASNRMQDLKDYMDELANLILAFPSIAQFSRFLLIPGPNDPGSSRALPRQGLFNICLQELQRKVPNVMSGTNPCRVRFYTQDIVIFRENLQQKMHRNALLPASDPTDNTSDNQQLPTVDITKHLVKTLIDQAHLCPLPLTTAPIHWNYDSSLQLFPLPDVLILADSSEQFQLGYSDVAVFHPGAFHVDYSFVFYRPSTNTTEFSRVE